MATSPLGALNPALLAQCPEPPRPANTETLPIHMTHWGSEGPSVLMIHGGVQGGIGGGPANFAGQQPLAERGWQIALMDRPGFGGSPSRGADDMEADSLLVAERLGESSHLIGHSFGGAEALLAAALRPDAVRSLILIEPALQPMLMVQGDAVAAKAVGEVVVKYLLTATTPAEFALNFAGSMGRDEEGGVNASVANIAADPERATRLGCALLRARAVSPVAMLAAAHAVRDAGIPVLVVSGGYSQGQEATAAAVAAATGGRHAVVDCASHFIQQAVPGAFNDLADAFLREAEARLG